MVAIWWHERKGGKAEDETLTSTSTATRLLRRTLSTLLLLLRSRIVEHRVRDAEVLDLGSATFTSNSWQ